MFSEQISMQGKDLQNFLLENCEFFSCPKGKLSAKHLNAYKVGVEAVTEESECN